MLTVGDKMPEFKLRGVVSREKGREFEEITHESHPGKWRVVFFWPMDFSLICPMEIAEFGRRHPDFEHRDAQLLGVSTDTHLVHLAWRRDHQDLRDLPYPMLADSERELSTALGILHKDGGVALRATFIVDPDGVIRFTSVNDLSVRGSVDEVLRVLDALQTDVCVSEAERHALEHDLELAARIQAHMLPDRELTFAEWQARILYQPACAVSGDYVDLIRSEADPHEAVFLFGDISGKGVAGSLLMANLHAIFRSLAPLGLPLEDLLERANRLFCQHTLPSAYATLVCGRLGPDGSVRLANAGHPPPLLIRRGHTESLEATGLPLGLFRGGRYSTRSLKLEHGDLLFLYTDGLTEAVDSDGQEYGRERLLSVLEGLPADEAISGVLADVTAFGRGARRTDDMTIMALRHL